MNITMNSAPLPAGSEIAANGVIAGAAPADALPLDPAQLAATGVPAAMPFLQFMDLSAVAAPGGETRTQETVGTDAALPDAALPDAAPVDAAAKEQAAEAGNGTLLAAMAMPLMPSMMMMAMPAALPAAVRFAAGAPEQGKRSADPAPVAAAAAAAAGVELPLAIAAPTAAAQVLPAQANTAAPQLARAGAALQAAPAAAATQPAAAAQPREAAHAEAQAAPSNGTSAGFGMTAPSAPAAAPRDGAPLTLAGPPTAWRQSLQEALGERLNIQLTKNAEQAVIRLEPPMLGRVEISIRHIAGSLEVNITATHSEVLRQLNSVSDNLRSDLAGRQYTDVSVNVSQAAPRAQAAAQHGAGADPQGRGRQQGQDQDERAPGSALADAHQPNTAFSLSARAPN